MVRLPSLSMALILISHLSQKSRAAALSMSSSLLSASRTILRRDETSQAFRSTWQNPTDTLSILLIIGGDVVLKALAQLSGRPLVPVAFSFGWVAYSFTTLMSAVGDGRLMPPPDYPLKVINAENGYMRDNKSWVLGRLLRDFEYPLPDDIGLSITVFEVEGGHEDAGVPRIDWYWISGLIVIVVQIGIAAIPLGLHKDWGILLLTVAGNTLALVTGALPQWRFEKWACRRNTKKVFTLTGGDGARHVMVIIGRGVGLDLEDLAVAESPRMRRRGEGNQQSGRWSKTVTKGGAKKQVTRMIKGSPTAFWVTQIACGVLAALWIAFLITVTSLKQNTWYLLAIGGIGMVQNAVVAGATRETSTSGIHLKEIERFQRQKVMDALMDLETAYKTVGRSLVATFFADWQSGLRPDEIKWWGGEKEDYERSREAKRPDSFGEQVLESASRARDEHALRLVGK